MKSYHQDFLALDPDDPIYSEVKYIIVDPSCSGSGKFTIFGPGRRCLAVLYSSDRQENLSSRPSPVRKYLEDHYVQARREHRQ